jgi:hypothetical protein
VKESDLKVIRSTVLVRSHPQRGTEVGRKPDAMPGCREYAEKGPGEKLGTRVRRAKGQLGSPWGRPGRMGLSEMSHACFGTSGWKRTVGPGHWEVLSHQR